MARREVLRWKWYTGMEEVREWNNNCAEFESCLCLPWAFLWFFSTVLYCTVLYSTSSPQRQSAFIPAPVLKMSPLQRLWSIWFTYYSTDVLALWFSVMRRYKKWWKMFRDGMSPERFCSSSSTKEYLKVKSCIQIIFIYNARITNHKFASRGFSLCTEYVSYLTLNSDKELYSSTKPFNEVEKKKKPQEEQQRTDATCNRCCVYRVEQQKKNHHIYIKHEWWAYGSRWMFSSLGCCQMGRTSHSCFYWVTKKILKFLVRFDLFTILLGRNSSSVSLWVCAWTCCSHCNGNLKVWVSTRN